MVTIITTIIIIVIIIIILQVSLVVERVLPTIRMMTIASLERAQACLGQDPRDSRRFWEKCPQSQGGSVEAQGGEPDLNLPRA